ncbi:IS110 family transposase [Micromonospora sp. NPDC050397]|uniref:IS110 family transposase n=1 Tax=Micromonospora sp. NPDC050397 TaxID=3364279 RepID=UPI00384E03B5
MTIVADTADLVIGVDTHTDTHTAVIVDRVGRVLADITVTTDPDGLTRLLTFADDHTPAGHQRLWAVEGTRSHGQGLHRLLHAAAETVVEAAKPVTANRRRGGKSDSADALHAARACLATTHPATPRANGTREALRILLTVRRHHSDTRTATINLIKSLILTADDPLRADLRHLTTNQQITYLTTLDKPDNTNTETTTRRHELHTLATLVADLDTTLRDNHRRLRALVTDLCPPLLAQPGVGPVTAAVALTTWSHPGRVRSEAAYANLAGTAPIPASSGRTNRHRLNRGGDRTLNSALHTIMLTRRRTDPATRDYITRRQNEGRTNPEINRCLKRYIARQLYRIMQANHTTT